MEIGFDGRRGFLAGLVDFEGSLLDLSLAKGKGRVTLVGSVCKTILDWLSQQRSRRAIISFRFLIALNPNVVIVLESSAVVNRA